MLNKDSSLYSIYLHFFAVVRSGNAVHDGTLCLDTNESDGDFAHVRAALSEEQTLAAALGVDDAKKEFFAMKTVVENRIAMMLNTTKGKDEPGLKQ